MIKVKERCKRGFPDYLLGIIKLMDKKLIMFNVN